MKKKKVLFLIESFIVGGAERVLIDIANNLDASKYDITVCSVYKHSVYKGYNKTFDNPFKSHIHYKYIINNHIGCLYIIFNYIVNKVPNLLYKLLIGDQYETVVAFYEGFPTYWIANTHLKRGKKIAWLHTSTKLSQHGKNKAELQKQRNYYLQYAKIIGVSQGVTDSFKELFPSIQNVEVIYNPINSCLIQEKASQSIPLKKTIYPTIVSVGRMTGAKGYERWLKVLLKLKNKGYKFQAWIIGGGNREEHERFVETNQLSDYVIFLGHIDNPYPYIATADWVACPSLLEGLSTVVLESIVLGKAILATDCPGMKELLGESQYGIVCDNNEDAIEKATEQIFVQTSLHEKFENLALIRKPFFELQKSINQIEYIIND